MILSKKSWHYRWYVLCFMKEPPKNFCPYFWLLVFACIVAPIVLLISLPYEVVRKVANERTNMAGIKDVGILSEYILFGLIVDIAILLFFVMVVALFFRWNKHTENLHVGTVVLWLVAILLFIRWRVLVYREKKRQEKRERMGNAYYNQPPKKNLLVEFIKAKYKKNCPLIEWKE